jgi:solute carrier family 25 S-adenosylmethionine transporter 26
MMTDSLPAGAFFTTYEASKSLFKNINPTLSGSSKPLIPDPFIHSAASSLSELVSCFILTPAEVLKQNAQMIRRPEHAKHSSASTIFQRSVTLETLKHFKRPSQLWRGYTALAARNLPFTAMQFPMFEHMKKIIKEYRQRKNIYTGSLTEHAISTGISAGSAGSIAAVITTPVDVVKTRIMLSAAGESSEIDAKKEVEAARAKGKSTEMLAKERGVKRKSGLAVAREVYRETGVKGLFRGGILRGGWTAIGSGLYLSTYEGARLYLERIREQSDGLEP